MTLKRAPMRLRQGGRCSQGRGNVESVGGSEGCVAWPGGTTITIAPIFDQHGLPTFKKRSLAISVASLDLVIGDRFESSPSSSSATVVRPGSDREQPYKPAGPRVGNRATRGRR